MPAKLSDDQIAGIRVLRRANPNLPYREISRLFKVSISAVAHVIAYDYRKPVMQAKERTPACPPPQPPDSFIRPIPLSRLMAGR